MGAIVRLATAALQGVVRMANAMAIGQVIEWELPAGVHKCI